MEWQNISILKFTQGIQNLREKSVSKNIVVYFVSDI